MGAGWHDSMDLLRLAWARAWRWVLWTPRRLAMTVAVLFVVLLGWSVLDGDEPPRTTELYDADTDQLPSGWEEWPTVRATGVGAEGEPGVGAPGAEETAHEGSDHADGASEPTRGKVARVSRRFVAGYLAEGPRKQWRAALAPLTTSGLGEALTTVDRANVPGERVTDVTVGGASEFAATATVSTDAGDYRLQLAFSGAAWEVSSVTPPAPSQE